jgi:hypothetical protein
LLYVYIFSNILDPQLVESMDVQTGYRGPAVYWASHWPTTNTGPQ